MNGSVLGGVALALACLLPALAWSGALDRMMLVLAGVALAVGATWPGPSASRRADPAGPARPDLPLSLDWMPDPVVLVERGGTVAAANAPALGLLPGLQVGRRLSFALRDPDVLAAVGIVAGAGGSTRIESGGRSPRDPAHEIRIVALGPDEAGGVERRVALFFRDLREQKRLEAMRVDFVANVSHELRTPLASVIGFIETLQGPARADPVARERFLVVMAAQAHRMRRLVDDLLHLSRVELREHVPPTGTVDLAAAVRHMVEVSGPRAAERGVRLSVEAGTGPVRVAGDRDELLRVLDNLVENAVRYGSPGGGTVEIALARPGPDRVVLSVRDHGPGIAPEHLPRLTERFYRAAATDGRAGGGTGLGLAIVKHIVARHRGTLAIASEAGKGSTVTISLPAAPPEPPAGPADLPAGVTPLS